jgi:malate synthase
MFHRYTNAALSNHLAGRAVPVPGVDGLAATYPSQLAPDNTAETAGALKFAVALYRHLKGDLAAVLRQREQDRDFIDATTRKLSRENERDGTAYGSSDYKTVIGLKDAAGNVVFGPKQAGYCRSGGAPMAPLPQHLQGNHVTVFGPPETPQETVDAVNSFHCKLPNEPAIVTELLPAYDPKWGADHEDSKTPSRDGLAEGTAILSKAYAGTLTAGGTPLAATRRALPMKRIPGLALPDLFHLVDGEPLPLHILDFALHMYHNMRLPAALTFYVPKLESELEARYVKKMVVAAEALAAAAHDGYAAGTVRLFVVLENPRVIFRVHEVLDELFPFVAGTSLGWHDYLASTARVFKDDPAYRVPVKADPFIVIKYIKASHEMLANVVGHRGGIKIGGMYGVLPVGDDFASGSFQVTLKGYFKDICSQLRRGLDGFWVGQPWFVRIGMAIVEAWKIYAASGDKGPMTRLVEALLVKPADRDAVKLFMFSPDIEGVPPTDPIYPRKLIAANEQGGGCIENNDPKEVRHNVFQILQYLAGWLSGRGCVALPAIIEGQPVRVLDDLATAERSRWEVWLEITHGRFGLAAFHKIAAEEMAFILADRTDGAKMVHVKVDDVTRKWYPVALHLAVRFMTDRRPVEFVTELLLPFTLPDVRDSATPLEAAGRFLPPASAPSKL